MAIVAEQNVGRSRQPKRRLNAIGPVLRRLRCERNWSQQVLAAKCQLLGWDIDRFTITRIEAGSRWVGDTELITLCRVLQITPADLLPSHWAGLSRVTGDTECGVMR